MRSCAVMVVNWNGADRLARCLPSVIAAAERVGAEVWVVDNGSTDGSEELCRTQFPGVRFERFEPNRSLASYNAAAERCSCDVVVSLDNDTVVDAAFLPPLLEHFNEDEVFAVTATLRPFPPGSAGAHNDVTTGVAFANGMLRRGDVRPADGPSHVFFNSGCGSARDRRKLLELGGFDELYFPLYHEDVDLSWRAWKRGWRCLYEPRSTVWHEGGGALGRSTRVSTLMVRNEFLFHWKNLTTRRMLAVHLAALGPRLLTAALRRDRARLLGFAHALRRLPAAASRRRAVRAQARVGDDAAVRAVNCGAASTLRRRS